MIENREKLHITKTYLFDKRQSITANFVVIGGSQQHRFSQKASVDKLWYRSEHLDVYLER